MRETRVLLTMDPELFEKVRSENIQRHEFASLIKGSYSRFFKNPEELARKASEAYFRRQIQIKLHDSMTKFNETSSEIRNIYENKKSAKSANPEANSYKGDDFLFMSG